MEMVSYSHALASKKANEFSGYRKTGVTNGTSGFERITSNDLAQIHHQPKFLLTKNERVFTIGSCFARNVENALHNKGVKVLAREHSIPNEFYNRDQKLEKSRGAFNVYTPKSMLSLLELAEVGPESNYGVVEVGEDEYVDMMLPATRIMSGAEIREVRSIACNAYKCLKEATTVVITLGYTESWYDKETSIFLNRAPMGLRPLMKLGERFAFYNDHYASIVETLENIVTKLNSICETKPKIILTVSPVPLGDTFTSFDIVRANHQSKSNLYAAANSFVQKHDSVDYYPSYEMVTFSHRVKSWGDDGAHVKHSVVSNVIGKFIDLYMK